MGIAMDFACVFEQQKDFALKLHRKLRKIRKTKTHEATKVGLGTWGAET